MRTTYYIFRLFTFLFRLIPFTIVPLLSRLLTFMLFSVAGYRKKVVKENIAKAFPEKDASWQKTTVKRFYRNLCDIILESMKGFTIGKKNLARRFVFTNTALLNKLYGQGQSVIAVGAHYANWEWGIMAAPLRFKHKIIAFYTPLTNRYIDDYVRKTRSNFGTELIPTNEVRKAFRSSDDTPKLWFFGADQSPSSVKGAHWMTFLNQDTPCNKGPEFFARIYDLPVVYFDVRRVRRGHYEVELSILETHSKQCSDGEITESYFKKLEQIVVNKPEDYLWSHRRWKHKRPANEQCQTSQINSDGNPENI